MNNNGCECGKLIHETRDRAWTATKFLHRKRLKKPLPIEAYRCEFGNWHLGHPIGHARGKRKRESAIREIGNSLNAMYRGNILEIDGDEFVVFP